MTARKRLDGTPASTKAGAAPLRKAAASPPRKPGTAPRPAKSVPPSVRAPTRAAEPAPTVRPGRGRRPAAWSNVVASQDEQFQLKRNALLREAARAFSARGFHNTSLDDVASSLGVTKAALYHYVSSKQEILFECHSMSLDLGDQALDHARANGRTGLEKISLVAGRYIELITSGMGRLAVLSEIDALPPDSRATIQRRRDAFEMAMRRIVEEGIADGSIRAVDPRLTVFFFMGAVNWMTRWFRPDGANSGGEVAQAFENLLTQAVRAS